MSTSRTSAPKITADAIRRVLGHSDSVVVHLLGIDFVDVAETGLSKAQAANENIVVVLTSAEARTYMDAADGDAAKAARTATAVLAMEQVLGGIQ